MKFWLHPEAREDLREAAEYYRDNVGAAFSQLLLAEFERSVNLLLEHPRLGSKWRYGKRRFVIRRFPFGLISTTSSTISCVSSQSRTMADVPDTGVDGSRRTTHHAVD